MTKVKSQVAKARGRPRSKVAHIAMLDAATRLISAGGIGAVTMEAVAKLAGVGKPTVYRNWANREELTMAALLKAGAPHTGVKETISAIDDLHRQLLNVARSFSSPRGRNALLMVASADPDSELVKAFRGQVMLASREEGRSILLRAIVENCIQKDSDIEIVLDMIYGSVFYRLQIGHAKVDSDFIRGLIDQVMRGIGPST
jgi:AcrR family transcriptional regulator